MGCRLQTCRWLAPQWFDSTFRATSFFFLYIHLLYVTQIGHPLYFATTKLETCENSYNFFVAGKVDNVSKLLTIVLFLSLPVLLLANLPTASVPVLDMVAALCRQSIASKLRGFVHVAISGLL